ncbi:MAG TPA: HAMP domain-containing sensor histidine kinase [Bacteroidales bacterium]|nr:HAMP domain-containing sensor histidine kinase [Bacteroidales bacterium]
MARLRTKLPLFNLLTKLVFTSAFLLLLPYIVKRVNLIQTDNDLVRKREQVISLISQIGIEPFIASDSSNAFGSYNILRDEFISIERTTRNEDINYIEETKRLIDNEQIDYRVLNYSLNINGKPYILSVGRSMTSIQLAEKNIRLVMLLFLAFIIIITFITDLLYTMRLLKPLNRIIDKLKSISDPSSYDRKPVLTSTSDFISLDKTLIDLMDNIDLLFRKEKETTVNISHELLTPVSVIRSKLENLLIREDISPEIADKIEESLKTLHRLQSLINSLLLIAKLESRQYLKEDAVSLDDILSEVAEEISPVADDAAITINKNFNDNFRFAKANKSLLFSMFYNIVNNALKNTPGGGKVEIVTYLADKTVIAGISDSGKGIPQEKMKTLFSRFKERGNEGSGTGIGLAIAKSIADFHAIEIDVESEIGKGTTFLFRIKSN